MAGPGSAHQNNFTFDSWTVQAKKSHILQSRCTKDSCKTMNAENISPENVAFCDFCL